MDFNLQEDSQEMSEFREEVRAWMEENMKGAEHLRWSASWSTRENDEEYSFRRGLGEKLGKKGWLFPMFPEEYGGAGLSVEHQFVLETELHRYGLGLTHVFYTLARIVAPVLIHWGTEEQKKEFLPPIARGEIVVWQVLTEPQSGSDVANCQTKAIRDGDDYIVNGQKVMVGHHLPPDALWALVCTDPDGKRHENLSWLHIPANLPGITIQHMHLMMGIKNAVFFDNVRVPAKYLIGGENNGWKVADTHLELEHGGDGRVGNGPGGGPGGGVLPEPRRGRQAAHRGSSRARYHRRHDHGDQHGEPHGAPHLLAPFREGAARLRRRPVPLLPAHGAAAERRTAAEDHGGRRADPG